MFQEIVGFLISTETNEAGRSHLKNPAICRLEYVSERGETPERSLNGEAGGDLELLLS